jgi:hypothetical protein
MGFTRANDPLVNGSRPVVLVAVVPVAVVLARPDLVDQL